MTTVRTVADSRVVAEQGVVLNQYVGPLNWEHYKIPASGLSNSQITFANLVTLGTNRIYDSNFQIEYTIEISLPSGTDYYQSFVETMLRPHPFPLHWVTDQLRTNINGAACMVRPQEQLFQRMMYWRQNVLDKTCNYCPHTKCPVLEDRFIRFLSGTQGNYTDVSQQVLNHQKKYGKNGSQNQGTPIPCVTFDWDNASQKARITFREPVLCPPFNQRLDEIYQGPLFNITSIDLVYQLNDLRMMFESSGYYTMRGNSGEYSSFVDTQVNGLNPSEMTIDIKDAQLCFNVASMPAGMTVPPTLQLPYYDNVCYVTNGGLTSSSTGEQLFTSGVYTLAQVPTAIYVFVSENQLYRSTPDHDIFEPSLSPIKSINITMGNNTQLLTTTSEYDRYQMALANGLEDVTWEEFTKTNIPLPMVNSHGVETVGNGLFGHSCKCMLRLIPGVDLLIPDKRLVGGTDAEQMVFQVRLTADVSCVPARARPYLSLWLMFEYVGTLTIEPVHASIDMLPLKTIPPVSTPEAITDTSVASASGGGEGTNPTGAGIFDIIKTGYKWAKKAWNSKIGKTLRSAADDFLSGGEPPSKGGRIVGGTIIGSGGIMGKYIQ